MALPRLTLAIDAAVTIKCFGVATSYLLVIGDQMPSVVRIHPLPTRRLYPGRERQRDNVQR